MGLTVPARGEFLFLARMTAAAAASRADFGYDQLEDLRLGLDELCLPLLQGNSSSGRLQLSFSWSADAVETVVTL
jgi:anti-sigma regulatory factor (Ser/Thr protein kinase)